MVKARRGLVAFCALLNVAPLLAWVSDLGSFHLWFLFVTVPALLIVGGVALFTALRPEADPYLRRAIVAGSLGGLIGTIGYDVFRIPFILGGLRLFAPIDSYGVLLTNAHASSGLTDFAGWTYHFTNGIMFGIAFAVVALGRKWPWAVLWGLVLETATIVTPFIDSYNLRGKWNLIVIAYLAHVAYGVPLGLVTQGAKTWDARKPAPFPMSGVLAVLVVVLGLWLNPTFSLPDAPRTTIKDARFENVWLRTKRCITLDNRDNRAYPLPDGSTAAAKSVTELCMDKKGAHRIKLTDEPYDGGFVLIDP